MTKKIEFYKQGVLDFTIETGGSTSQEIWFDDFIKLSPKMMVSETSYFAREPQRLVFKCLKDTNTVKLLNTTYEYDYGVSWYEIKYYVDNIQKFKGFIDVSFVEYDVRDKIITVYAFAYYKLFNMLSDILQVKEGYYSLASLLSTSDENNIKDIIEDALSPMTVSFSIEGVVPTINVADKFLFFTDYYHERPEVTTQHYSSGYGFYSWQSSTLCIAWSIYQYRDVLPSGITGVTIDSPGANYPNIGALSITGDGFGAAGFYTAVNGSLTNVVITNPGQQYTEATIEAVDVYGNGIGASLTAIFETYIDLLAHNVQVTRIFPKVQFSFYDKIAGEFRTDYTWFDSDGWEYYSGNHIETVGEAQIFIDGVLGKYGINRDTELDTELNGYTILPVIGSYPYYNPNRKVLKIEYTGNAISSAVFMGDFYNTYPKNELPMSPDGRRYVNAIDYLNTLLFYYNFFIYNQPSGQFIIDSREWGAGGSAISINAEHLIDRKMRRRLKQKFPYQVLDNLSGDTSVLADILKEEYSTLFSRKDGIECYIFGIATYNLDFGDVIEIEHPGRDTPVDYRIDYIQTLPEKNMYYIKAWAV